MTNPFYTATGNPTTAARGISSVVREEFADIQAGFDGANTQIVAKGAVAGQAWTGAQDFSGATLTAATQSVGDSSTKVATTAFVASISLSSALPGQGGSADKLITTNGTVASWTQLLKAGTLRWADSTDTTKRVAYDLSGITTGTTRMVTMPNQSGTLAMLSDFNLVLLAVLFPTAAANLDALNSFTATYDNYLIIGDNIAASAGDTLAFRFANAGTPDSGANYLKPNIYSSVTGTAVTAASAVTLLSASATKTINFELRVKNTNDATNAKFAVYEGGMWDGANAVSDIGSFIYKTAATLSGIRFFWNSGANFGAQGRIRIYGYN